ncbi:hypothetical protein PCL_02314 [Purpureocillium lilacinum]|uniref:Uncharacterized protein n=1 Tax=Purpureocillium lilacinum TaxID=33203 RepID=A0A2U3E095_PURLI|nr:hypothetical protein PCL_02314 [Purpureocillium lilacinum]
MQWGKAQLRVRTLHVRASAPVGGPFLLHPPPGLCRHSPPPRHRSCPLSSPALALALNPRPSWVSLPRSEQLPADGGASSSALGGLKPSTRPAGPARQRGSTGRQTQARLPSGSSEPRRPSSRSWLAAKLPIFQALDARRSRSWSTAQHITRQGLQAGLIRRPRAEVRWGPSIPLPAKVRAPRTSPPLPAPHRQKKIKNKAPWPEATEGPESLGGQLYRPSMAVGRLENAKAQPRSRAPHAGSLFQRQSGGGVGRHFAPVSRFDGPHKRRDHRPHGPNRKRVENALDVNKQSLMGREGGVDDGDRHADIRDPRAGKPQEKCSHSLLYYCTLNCSHTKNPVWRVTSAAPVDPRVLGDPEGPKAIGCPLAVCGDRIQVRAWDGGMPCLALPRLAFGAAGHGHDDRPARAPCLARWKRADVSSSSRQLFHHRCQHLGPATRSRTGPAMRKKPFAGDGKRETAGSSFHCLG